MARWRCFWTSFGTGCSRRSTASLGRARRARRMPWLRPGSGPTRHGRGARGAAVAALAPGAASGPWPRGDQRASRGLRRDATTPGRADRPWWCAWPRTAVRCVGGSSTSSTRSGNRWDNCSVHFSVSSCCAAESSPRGVRGHGSCRCRCRGRGGRRVGSTMRRWSPQRWPGPPRCPWCARCATSAVGRRWRRRTVRRAHVVRGGDSVCGVRFGDAQPATWC
ncbi:MAG: hypothetical protein RI990_923 [Planctomycetota bacterium]